MNITQKFIILYEPKMPTRRSTSFRIQYFLIYCRHVLKFPMVFVRSQHRPEITMYSSIIFFMLYVTYSSLQSAPEKKSKHRKLWIILTTPRTCFGWRINVIAIAEIHCRWNKKNTHKMEIKTANNSKGFSRVCF